MFYHIIIKTGLKPIGPRTYSRLFKYIQGLTENITELAPAPPKTGPYHIYNMYRTTILQLT